MDEFFEDLDLRLSVSGMVTDSFMTGIMNTVMEESFDKGDLERLDEKSRFYEMAILELQRCLKFEQEELNRFIFESDRQRDRLVLDLKETRDRIQRQLEEKEYLIAEKDGELAERAESELVLKQALELRDEEICSLHAEIELERSKNERLQALVFSNGVSGEEDIVDDFCELKNNVDQQLWGIEGKLVDGRTHLVEEMWEIYQTKFQNQSEFVVEEDDEQSFSPNMNFHASSSEVLNDEYRGSGVHKSDGISEIELQGPSWGDIQKLCLATSELTSAYDQMTVDIEILKGTLELVFEKMENMISLSKVSLMEQQWVEGIEKDTSFILFRGFLEDLQENPGGTARDGTAQVPAAWSGEHLLEMMEAVSSLHHELEALVTQNDVSSKSIIIPGLGGSSSNSSLGGMGRRTFFKSNPLLECISSALDDDRGAGALVRYAKSDVASSKVEEFGPLDHLLKEDPAGHFNRSVAEMVRNHESIIQKKTKEIQALNMEILREKGCLPLRKDEDIDTIRKRILEVILKLDNFIQESSKLFATPRDYRQLPEKDMNFPDNLFLRHIIAVKEKEDTYTISHMSDKLTDALDRSPTEANPYVDTQHLKQEIEELSFLTMIMEETYEIILKGLAMKQLIELEDNEIEIRMRQDIYTIAFKQMAGNWNDEIEHHIENHIREEVYQLTFKKLLKDIEFSTNLALENCQKAMNENFLEDLPAASHLDQSQEIRGHDNLRLQSEFINEDDLILNYSFELIKRKMDLDPFFPELEQWNIHHDGMLIDENGALDLVNSKLEKALQQIIQNKAQLGELGSNFNTTEEDLEEANGHKITLDREALHFRIENEENGENHGHITTLDRDQVPCLPAENGENEENQQDVLQYVAASLIDFSKVIMDFECMIYEKVGVTRSRLEEVSHQLDLFVQHVSSLKKKESIYRNGFKRRCCDLLKAEAEVDLLADEVDVLVGLLEKTYIVLDHYSPILQHYAGITDLLKLIERALQHPKIDTNGGGVQQ